jgi:hypothetical protein
MIPGEELARWLRDDARQAQTMGGIDRVSRRLKALPSFERLAASLDRLARPRAADILECARIALADGQMIGEAFACLVQGAAADPYFRPPLRNINSEIHSGILLLDRPELTVFLAVLGADGLAAKRLARRGPASIVFSGQQSLYKFVRAGGATLSFWEAPAIGPGFTAPASGACRLTSRRRIADGEELLLDGRRQGFVVDHAPADLFYIQAITTAECAPLTVEYDCDSLRFAGASSTDEVSSRTQMMLTLLRTLDRRDAVPVFVAMLRHRHFYARWQAMRELLALDCDAARPHLQAMAEADPHPEVRDAAAAALASCFPAAAAPASAAAAAAALHLELN